MPATAGRRCSCRDPASRPTCGARPRTSRCSPTACPAGQCATPCRSHRRATSGCSTRWSSGSPPVSRPTGSLRSSPGPAWACWWCATTCARTDDVPAPGARAPGARRLARASSGSPTSVRRSGDRRAWSRRRGTTLVADGGWHASYPAVEVYSVDGATDAAGREGAAARRRGAGGPPRPPRRRTARRRACRARRRRRRARAEASPAGRCS